MALKIRGTRCPRHHEDVVGHETRDKEQGLHHDVRRQEGDQHWPAPGGVDELPGHKDGEETKESRDPTVEAVDAWSIPWTATWWFQHRLNPLKSKLFTILI